MGELLSFSGASAVQVRFYAEDDHADGLAKSDRGECGSDALGAQEASDPAGCSVSEQRSRKRISVFGCFQGSVTVRILGRTENLCAGDAVVWASSGEAAQTKVFERSASLCAQADIAVSALDYLSDLFMESSYACALYQLAEKPDAEPVKVGGLFTRDMHRLLKRIAFEMPRFKQTGHRLTTFGLVGDLIEQLGRAMGASHASDLCAQGILAYMRNNLATVTLQDAADHFYCHPNSISNIIKRETGMTFHEALTEMKMRQACTMIRGTNLSIQRVAEQCGYHNMTHFYSLFRKRFGVNPSDLRQGSPDAFAVELQEAIAG